MQVKIRISTWLLLFSLIPVIPVGAANWTQCLIDVRSGRYLEGGRDNHGRNASLNSSTTAISYRLCVEACHGSKPEPLQWSVFSQQFGSWLLPWLALVSQLPFGANDNLDNLIATLLTVGSPTLAAYSLALTVLNGRWIARRFASSTYPNTRNAVRILSSLQQAPLRVVSEGPLLPSLVVLPENDEWWAELVVWLDYTHTWSISAAASIAWVIIAYIFTVIDSFTTDLTNDTINATGEAIGSVWIWLLPIVVGWLQISPKCDLVRLHQAVNRANQIAYVAGAVPEDEPQLARDVVSEYAVSLAVGPGDVLRRDEACTVPIFNYARFPSWVEAVETVAKAFDAASENARQHRPVCGTWVKEKKPTPRPHDENRVGGEIEVEKYCITRGESLDDRRSVWGPNVWSRMFIASLLAILLQWGTLNAAVIAQWFTPTIGLGCRSGAYLLYGAVSTLIWALLLTSSILSHYVTTTFRHPSDFRFWAARLSSIFLRRVGKLLAVLNAIWIVVLCIFQFSNFFDRCWCNSSVLMWGKNDGYAILQLLESDKGGITAAWVGGVVLAATTATVFIIFINLFINPPLPASIDDQL